MNCKMCGSPMTEETSLRQDCGGDCLLCMAQAGDTDCIETAFRLLLEESGSDIAADTLTEQGVFKGAHGLEGLANSQEFWDRQPYGTRLYYGDGIADYMHRDVLRAAIQALAHNV